MSKFSRNSNQRVCEKAFGSTPRRARRDIMKGKCMKKFISSFAQKESGAITTEFLVICAAVVGLGIVGAGGLKGSAPVPEPDVNKTLNRFTAGFE